jgi:hypothetical protein
MSVSAPCRAQLYILPDDVLRALAEFMPLSGLLSLFQSSRWLQSILRHQLSRRLDDVFAHSTTQTMMYSWCIRQNLPISSNDLERKVRAIFGEANVHPNVSYVFSEAPKGYDGPLGFCRHSYVQGYGHGGSRGARYSYQVGSANFSPQRFVGWLHRRHNQLQTKEASL